jgi:RNA 2',3'-cyclic 3'-phosphodiesterase
MLRLFIAIDLPEPIKMGLADLCSGLPDAKWIKHEQMHLTLHFIGDVDESGFAAIKSALTGVAAPTFTMHLEGVGQFPTKGKPRVLWVGVKAPPLLADLYQNILSSLTALSLPPPDHPFSPHITLARFKTPPPTESIRPFFAQHATFKTESFLITEFILFSSTLTPRGSVYRPEGIYPLSAPPDA